MGAICEHLQAVSANQIPRLLINIPPGCSKSLLTSVFWPMWEWITHPEIRWFYASYDQRLSTRDSVKCRSLVFSPWYQSMWGDKFYLTHDQNQKTYYETDKGGYRMATSVGGHGTGEHPDRIVCLPWESVIITDRGLLPIGRIVDEEVAVSVLSFNHVRNQEEWQPIEKYECSVGRPLSRISFVDGSFLEVTGDHPVYVIGKGYVKADCLNPGDEVIDGKELCRLRQGVQQQTKQEGSLLLFRLLQQIQEKGRNFPVFGLRQTGLSNPSSQGQDEDGDFLLPQMPWGFDQGKEPSALSGSCQEKLRSMQQGFFCGEKEKEYSHCLRTILSQQMDEGQPSETPTAFQEGMRVLWDGNEHFEKGHGSGNVLLKKLCQQSPFGKDEGREEPELCEWELLGGIFQEIRQVEEKHKSQGGFLLFPVREGREGQWTGIRHTPCRLRQGQRLPEKSGWPVQGLSQQPQRRGAAADSLGTKVVSFVERKVRIPEKVYNIRVAENHNYFAEGILVHNCDDPHNVSGAESELERLSTLEWWDQTMGTRGVSRGARRVIIMQRLHYEDLAGHVLERGDWVHICLPMRYEENRMPDTPLGWNDPRIEEGELLTPNQFDEAKVHEQEKSLGAYGTAGQLQQNPVPKEGGMFKETFFNQRPKAAPYNARRVRYWDRAASEGHGCFTAGTLIAMCPEGNFYVEHVVHGQWEPDSRDEHIVATALADRSHYGPNNVPVIYIEHEPGSSGVDAYKHTARKLAGFSVLPDRPTGSKEIRAEPWASQCAAKNVFLVDNGTWDIDGWIKEHCQFPMGKLKDRVDSASGAFGKLSGALRPPASLHVYSTQKKKGQIRLVVCSLDELPTVIIDDHRCLLIAISDPVPEIKEVMCSVESDGNTLLQDSSNNIRVNGGNGLALSPPGHSPPLHALRHLVDYLSLSFADLDPADCQSNWGEAIEPYGLSADKLVMDQASGKSLWRFLTRKRDPMPDVILFADSGDRRALSMAMGVADIMGLPRKASIYSPSGSDNIGEGNAPNGHVYRMVRSCRGMVV